MDDRPALQADSPSDGAPWHALGPLEGLSEGLLQEALVGGEPLLVVRRGAEVLAADAHCPHKFGRLADGALAGALLTCPMHTATFDLRTGRPLTGQEWAGRLQTYPTRIRDGVVEIQRA